MRNVSIGSFFHDGGIEVPKMMIDKLADAACFHRWGDFVTHGRILPCSLSIHNQSIACRGRIEHAFSSVKCGILYGNEARIRATNGPGAMPNNNTVAPSTDTVRRSKK